MKFALSHAIKEDSRKKCYYFICLFACFLVSLVSLVSKSIVTQGSLIFLMLSEKERGEMDIVFELVTSRRKENIHILKIFILIIHPLIIQNMVLK